MNRAQMLLQELGLPTGDRHDLPSSTARFPDGAQYRIEIPSVEGPEALQAVLETARTLGVTIHRVSQGSGIMMLSESEVHEMARIGANNNIEVSLFVGPRAPWEGSAQSGVPDGKIFGWRHTGMDQLVYAFSDVEFAVTAGIRGVLVADEGLNWLVGRARKLGVLPSDLVVKGSALLGVTNPIAIRLLVEAGMDTINVASDITLAKLAALRQVISIPIDLYIEGPDGLGGFTRYYELAELIRVAAPIYLKFGLRNAPGIYPSGLHLQQAAIQTGRERVRRALLGMEILARSGTNWVMSQPGAPGLGIPRIV